MRRLFGRPVFRVGETAYYWDDVVLYAMVRGDWALLIDEVRKGLACIRQMEERGEALTDKEMDKAMTDFRYTHGLISAEEMEQWLKQWELSTSDWIWYMRAAILKDKCSGSLGEILSRFPIADEETEGTIMAQGVCSGRLAAFCRKLAVLASMYDAHHNSPEADGEAGCRVNEKKALLASFYSNMRMYGPLPFTEETRMEKVQRLADMELCFRHACEQIPTREAIHEQIRYHNFDWIRIEGVTLCCPDEHVAREAALCVKEEGARIEEIAALMKSQVREIHHFLDELDPSLQSHFLCARIGEVVGPLYLAGNPNLVMVRNKTLPSEDDSRLLEKARERILNEIVEHEIHDRVQWDPDLCKE